MKLTIHRKAADFLVQAQAALASDEVVNNLMLGIALRLQAVPEMCQTPYLATIADSQSGTLIFAALMTPPFPLTVFGPTGDVQVIDQAFSLIGDDLRHNGWPVPAISGCAPVVAQCAATWCAQTGDHSYVRMHERIYALSQVIPLPVPPSGHARPATADETDLMAQWAYAFMREALPNQPAELDPDDTRWRIDKGDIIVWDDGGQAVSMAWRMRQLATVASVGMVYTPPAWRGHGYASACVAALSQRHLDQGFQRCVLFTDLANPTSNSIYQKIGYVPVCDYDEIGLLPQAQVA